MSHKPPVAQGDTAFATRKIKTILSLELANDTLNLSGDIFYSYNSKAQLSPSRWADRLHSGFINLT